MMQLALIEGIPASTSASLVCTRCKGAFETECNDCDGTGDCTCHCGADHECGICDGEGKTECDLCDGTGSWLLTKQWFVENTTVPLRAQKLLCEILMQQRKTPEDVVWSAQGCLLFVYDLPKDLGERWEKAGGDLNLSLLRFISPAKMDDKSKVRIREVVNMEASHG